MMHRVELSADDVSVLHALAVVGAAGLFAQGEHHDDPRFAELLYETKLWLIYTGEERCLAVADTFGVAVKQMKESAA